MTTRSFTVAVHSLVVVLIVGCCMYIYILVLSSKDNDYKIIHSSSSFIRSGLDR